jgi:hypothetical protein
MQQIIRAVIKLEPVELVRSEFVNLWRASYKWLDQCERYGEVTDSTCGAHEATLLYGQYASLIYSVRSEKITRDKQSKHG